MTQSAPEGATSVSTDVWHRSPDVRVAALTGAMLIAAALFMLLIPDPLDATVETNWWVVVGIAIVFGVLENAVFNVVFRRPDGHFGWIDPVLNEAAQNLQAGYGLLEWPALRRKLDRIDGSYAR